MKQLNIHLSFFVFLAELYPITLRNLLCINKEMPPQVTQGMAKRIFQGAKDQNGSETQQVPILTKKARLTVRSTKLQSQPHLILAHSRGTITAPNHLAAIFDPGLREILLPVEETPGKGGAKR